MNMKKLLRKMVLYGVPIMLLSIFTFLAFQYVPEKRGMVFLLVFATTLLTVSSLAGYYFIKVYVVVALNSVGNHKRFVIGLVLAAVSFGISFGSVALLKYLLSRV
jgi:hypothetical protein